MLAHQTRSGNVRHRASRRLSVLLAKTVKLLFQKLLYIKKRNTVFSEVNKNISLNEVKWKMINKNETL